MLKVDAYNHIMPIGFFNRLKEVSPNPSNMQSRVRQVPMMTDLDERFRIMDSFDEYCQILSLSSPPIEISADPKYAVELMQMANDEMAELCNKYPDRFPGFIASLPFVSTDAMLDETHRAMKELRAVGVQCFTNDRGKAMDGSEYMPLYDAMAEYDRPIWVHPTRGPNFPDYLTEDVSQYEIWWTFGWPYETSTFMARLVFAKLFDRLPNLKIITHHGGAMIPFFEGRVGPGWDQLGKRTSSVDYSILLNELEKRPLDYFRMFYADTAVFGSDSATRCCLDFFGVDHVLFASDAPFDPEGGPMYIRETIRIIDALDLSEEDRRRIYRDNAVEMLGLTLND
jgi:aminocarboxymuconate-semialdehyde decarboxylase